MSPKKGLDTKTYWLTDRQPQCDFDSDFETKRVMAQNWPHPSPASKNALWDAVLDAREEVAHNEGYAATLVESVPRRMQMVIDSEGYCTPY
jgi:hypothetical protein